MPTVASFFAVYITAQIVSRIVIRRIVKNPTLGRFDKVLGFSLGAAKTSAILFVAISALLFFEKPIQSVSPALHFETKGSEVAAFVRAHNLFTTLSFPGLKGLTAMSKAAVDPEAAASMADDPAYAKLKSDPKFKSLMADDSVREALLDGDYMALMKSNKVLELLTDPKLQESLGSLGSLGALSEPEKPAKGGHKDSKDSKDSKDPKHKGK